MAGSRSRLQADSVWEVANFLLNGLVFILIGLQLHPIFLTLAGQSLPHLIAQAIAISLAAIVMRIIWVFVGATLMRTLDFNRENVLSLREEAVIAWTGMRGVVSLATAQALPLTFPHRSLILFLTFGVIFATLVGQGLSLPFLIRSVGLAEDDTTRREEIEARLAATEAALAELDTRPDDGASPGVVDDVRRHLMARVHILRSDGGRVMERHNQARTYRDLQRDLIQVERRTILELRDRGAINDKTLRNIQRDLDLEELRLSLGAHREHRARP
jgi:CPA1 family monovalent cation:H+ antiporter